MAYASEARAIAVNSAVRVIEGGVQILRYVAWFVKTTVQDEIPRSGIYQETDI